MIEGNSGLGSSQEIEAPEARRRLFFPEGISHPGGRVWRPGSRQASGLFRESSPVSHRDGIFGRKVNIGC